MIKHRVTSVTVASVVLFSSSLVHAAGHHIQLAGIPDRASFAVEGATLWGGMKKKGYTGTLILGSNGGDPIGDWSYAKGATEVRKSDSGTLELLGQEAKRVKSGEPLLMFVGDHGVSNNGWTGNGGSGSPEKTGMVMSMWPFGTFVSWPEVVDTLRTNLPQKSKLKIVAGPCFSGGVHAAVAKVEGACAISSSDYLSVGYSSISDDDQNFDEAVADQLSSPRFDPDKSGKSSLMEAWLYGLEKDFWISGARSGISSFDFVDSVLEEGPYHEDREDLSEWPVEVGDEINTCSNAPFSLVPIRASQFRDFDSIAKKIREDEAAGDWNDIPEELRKIYDKAITDRGFLGDVFSSRDLKSLRNADETLSEKAYNEELKALMKEWDSRNDPNGPQPVREYFKILNQKGGRELQEINARLLAAEHEMKESNREYDRAQSKLNAAWFFVEEKAKSSLDANERRLQGLVALRALETRKKEILSKSPDLEERLGKAEAARNEYIAGLQRTLQERQKRLYLSRPVLDFKEARVAMLREKMVRVARFMKQATPAQKNKYMSLLKCELEDI